MSQQQPATAAEAAEWLREQGYQCYQNDTPNTEGWTSGIWWVQFKDIRAPLTDEEVIKLAANRQRHLAAGPDAWLQEDQN